MCSERETLAILAVAKKLKEIPAMCLLTVVWLA